MMIFVLFLSLSLSPSLLPITVRSGPLHTALSTGPRSICQWSECLISCHLPPHKLTPALCSECVQRSSCFVSWSVRSQLSLIPNLLLQSSSGAEPAAPSRERLPFYLSELCICPIIGNALASVNCCAFEKENE